MSDNSPFFTAPRYAPGQLVIPMGTHHLCAKCEQSFICDQAHCALSFGQEHCPNCIDQRGLGAALPHSQREENHGRPAVQELDKPEQGSLF